MAIGGRRVATIGSHHYAQQIRKRILRSVLRSPFSGLLLTAAAVEAAFLSLHAFGELRYHVPETVAILLLAFSLYIVSVYLALEFSGPDLRRLFGLALGAALVFRLTAWPLMPELSDDLYRYRWEGLLQAHGGNPYQSRPTDPAWERLRDETYERISGRDFKAGYGPLIELIEWGTYRTAAAFTSDPWKQAFWFKLPAALFDLGIVAALAALLRARGLPAHRVLIYAWSPLAVFEFWAAGHNDAVVVFFVVLALWLAARQRWTWAFAALTLASAAKIWPLVLFPLFAGWEKWRPLRWRQAWIAGPIAFALVLPYWSDVTENIRFMSGFLGGWRNNDSLYGLLLYVAGDQYPAKYTAFAIVILAALAVTVLAWPLERAALWVIAVMLAVSANCHPWYLTWILPLLAISPVPALLLWSGLMPLAYRVVIGWALLGQWNGSTPWRWLIYLPVYGLLAGSALARRRRSKPEEHQR